MASSHSCPPARSFLRVGPSIFCSVVTCLQVLADPLHLPRLYAPAVGPPLAPDEPEPSQEDAIMRDPRIRFAVFHPDVPQRLFSTSQVVSLRRRMEAIAAGLPYA